MQALIENHHACMVVRMDFPKTQGVKIRREVGLTSWEWQVAAG
jgi:hypothetical protein